MVTTLERKGIDVYHALGKCVEKALESEDSEYALICGSSLLKLAELENANYFGATMAGKYN